MAGMLADEDPQLAWRHARAARSKGGRISVVRETVGLVAYRAGEWAEAISELRAARRMSGGPGQLPVMADCERALGHPEKAIELSRSAGAAELDPSSAAEMRIVVAGARADLGQLAAALAHLEGVLPSSTEEPFSARLFYAYADLLLQAERRDEAIDWFMKAAEADPDEETDVGDRLTELADQELTDVPQLIDVSELAADEELTDAEELTDDAARSELSGSRVHDSKAIAGPPGQYDLNDLDLADESEHVTDLADEEPVTDLNNEEPVTDLNNEEPVTDLNNEEPVTGAGEPVRSEDADIRSGSIGLDPTRPADPERGRGPSSDIGAIDDINGQDDGIDHPGEGVPDNITEPAQAADDDHGKESPTRPATPPSSSSSLFSHDEGGR